MSLSPDSDICRLRETACLRAGADLLRITAMAWVLECLHEQLKLWPDARAVNEVVIYPVIDPDNRPAPGERGDSAEARARKARAERMIKGALRRGHSQKMKLALNRLRCEECDSHAIYLVEPLDLWCWECKECGAVQRGAQQAQAAREILESAAPSMFDVALDPALEQDPEQVGCVVCNRGHESAEFKGTCDTCGVPIQISVAELRLWIDAPERNMRCRQCGEKSMARMPGGEIRCHNCGSGIVDKIREEPIPSNSARKTLADFVSCNSCGGREVLVLPNSVKCLRCNVAVASELAKMAIVQKKQLLCSQKPEPAAPVVKVFDMRELAAQIDALDTSDSETKPRVMATIKKLADAGEVRSLSLPKMGWSDLLHVFAEMHPNFTEVIETNIRSSLAIAAAGGRSRPAPALLLSEPGVGKSFFSECLAFQLEIPHLKVDMAAETNGAALVGSSSFWSNSTPGELFKLLAFGAPGKEPTANPLVFVDEIDKVSGNMRYNPLAGLYSLLEVESAKQFEDQSIQGVHIDASHIRWLLACNSARDLPAPILSRLHVFEIPELTLTQKRHMFARIFGMVVDGIGLESFDAELPESIIKNVDGLGMREFKTLVGVAVGRALEANRFRVEVNDFRSAGFEVVKSPMGFR